MWRKWIKGWRWGGKFCKMISYNILLFVCVGYFLFRCGCQLAEVHISSLLIWGRLLDNYFATHAVCVWSTFCFSLLVKDIETNLQKSTSPPHLSGCLLNYFANHAILCVCVEHFLFQDIETNLQKFTSPPHLSGLPPSQLASLFVPRALHSIMLVAEVGRVKAQRDHKIESVWKVADLKWSSRWTSFVFESTGTQPLNPHFPTIATVVTAAHYIETTRLKESEIKRQIWNGERMGTTHHCSDLPLFSVAPPFNPQLPSFPRHKELWFGTLRQPRDGLWRSTHGRKRLGKLLSTIEFGHFLSSKLWQYFLINYIGYWINQRQILNR